MRHLKGCDKVVVGGREEGLEGLRRRGTHETTKDGEVGVGRGGGKGARADEKMKEIVSLSIDLHKVHRGDEETGNEIRETLHHGHLQRRAPFLVRDRPRRAPLDQPRHNVDLLCFNGPKQGRCLFFFFFQRANTNQQG